MKKKYYILLSVMFVIFLASCSNKTRSSANFVQNYYTMWTKGEMTPELSYDEYLSETSKQLLSLSKEDYVNFLEEDMTTRHIQYLEVKDVKSTSINDTMYKVERTLKANINGVEQTLTDYDYVINENGDYKFLRNGIYSKETVDTTFSSEKFSISLDTIYYGIDRITINLIAKNPTSQTYGIGVNGYVTLETNNNVYEKVIPAGIVVKSSKEVTGQITFNNAYGNVKRIIVHNIFELDGENKPKDKNNPSSAIIFEKE